MEFTLASASFGDRSQIPVKHTCDGEDISPPLAWHGVPAGTKSLVLIVDDPDAPDPKAPKMVWVHWIIANLPVDLEGLAEGASGDLPAGVIEGINDFGGPGWRGPCPPIGRHRYFFKLYALDTVLADLEPSIRKPDLEARIQPHVLEKAEIVGLYERPEQPG